MLMKADRLLLKKLFSKAILRLCRSNLGPHSEFQIDAMIGITFGDSDVALICINEMVTDDGEAISQIHDTDQDQVAEAFEYQELGSSKSFGTAEGLHIGNESYGDDLDPEKCEMRWAGSETFGHGCEDVENGVSSDQHLYDNEMVDEGDCKGSGAIVTGSKKRKKSFAAGCDQFFKKEFDREVEDRVAVKVEPGLNESDFNETFGLEHTRDSRPVKPHSPSQRVHYPDVNFVSFGVTSKNRFHSWSSKKKNIGLQFGRKVPGNKKTSIIAVPTAPSALQSHVRRAFALLLLSW